MAGKRKSVTEEVTTGADINFMVNNIVDSIKKEFKGSEDNPAYIFGQDDASDVTEYVPTGLDILDLAISNKPNGGWPVGRISEITGLEASGKSLLAAYALKNTQARGGIAVYVDTESAASKSYMEAIGIDINSLIYVQLSALEDVFHTVDIIIEKVRASGNKKLVTIVIDSIMGATTKIEEEATYEKDGWATAKAIIMSKAMRKITRIINRQKICLICTNQLRERLGAMFGEKYATSGGKALGFHSSVRVKLESLGKIKMKSNGIDNVVGIKTKASVFKNRLGPPLKKVEYDIYYQNGIDNYGSWLKTLKDYQIVTQGGAYYTFKMSTPLDIISADGEELNQCTEIKFQSKDFANLMEFNKPLKKLIYDIVCEKYIMKYEVNKDYGVDDIEIDETDTTE